MDIHLLHKKDDPANEGLLQRVDQDSEAWESGYWAIPYSTAEEAVTKYG